MKLPHRRQFVQLAASATALPTMSRFAMAQAYPSRPVRIVVPYAPGGTSDISARLIGQWLSERLGQQFVVENRPGAGTNIGTEAVVRAPADGTTLLLVTGANAINATFYDRLNFVFLRDIVPVGAIMRVVNVLEVHPSVPVSSVPELIAYAKANSGKINMASAGIGSPTHVAGELFKMMTGVDMVHVPYRGAAPALSDLLTGQVQVLIDNMPTSIEHIRAGRVRGGCDVGEALGRAADGAGDRRVRAGLRSHLVLRHRRAARYADGNRRQAQQGNQYGSRRSQDESAPCRFGKRSDANDACRVRQARRRRNREMGHGDQVRGHQAGVTRQSRQHIP
jgi:tripartite-type tricarboxylate transporter receptor subunit TctC